MLGTGADVFGCVVVDAGVWAQCTREAKSAPYIDASIEVGMRTATGAAAAFPSVRLRLSTSPRKPSFLAADVLRIDALILLAGVVSDPRVRLVPGAIEIPELPMGFQAPFTAATSRPLLLTLNPRAPEGVVATVYEPAAGAAVFTGVTEIELDALGIAATAPMWWPGTGFPNDGLGALAALAPNALVAGRVASAMLTAASIASRARQNEDRRVREDLFICASLLIVEG